MQRCHNNVQNASSGSLKLEVSLRICFVRFRGIHWLQWTLSLRHTCLGVSAAETIGWGVESLQPREHSFSPISYLFLSQLFPTISSSHIHDWFFFLFLLFFYVISEQLILVTVCQKVKSRSPRYLTTNKSEFLNCVNKIFNTFTMITNKSRCNTIYSLSVKHARTRTHTAYMYYKNYLLKKVRLRVGVHAH